MRCRVHHLCWMGLLALAGAAIAATAEQCSITASRWDERLSFTYGREDCAELRHCHEGNSDMPWNRWTGVAPEDLQHEGAALDARMRADAGEIRCVGKVHDGALLGEYSFTPSAEFAKRMEAMGFGEQTPDRLQTYAFLDVSTAWVNEMQQTRVTGMTSENLIALRALKVDPSYVRGMAACGYPELEAQKLVSMKAVGVSPEKVKAVRAMGFSPTQEELIQMAVFKIDAPFVERMKARGFKNPTISQLVQIKIFKLDE